MRKGFKERLTKETEVSVAINIDGTGKCNANTPVHFLNHMFDVRFLSDHPYSLVINVHAWAPNRSKHNAVAASI